MIGNFVIYWRVFLYIFKDIRCWFLKSVFFLNIQFSFKISGFHFLLDIGLSLLLLLYVSALIKILLLWIKNGKKHSWSIDCLNEPSSISYSLQIKNVFYIFNVKYFEKIKQRIILHNM